MNLITALTTTAATFGERPQESAASVLLAGAIGLAFVALALAVNRCDKADRLLPVTVLSALLIGGTAITGGAIFMNADLDRADKEVTAWNTEVSAWAEDIYGVTAGIEEIRYGGGSCPTDNTCYEGKVLIGDTLTAVALVYIGDRTLLVSGDGGDQKEILRVDTSAAVDNIIVIQ